MSSRFSRGRYPIRRPPSVCKSKPRRIIVVAPPARPPWPQATLYMSWHIIDPSNSPPWNDAQADIPLIMFGLGPIWYSPSPPFPYTYAYVDIADSPPVGGSGNTSAGDHSWTTTSFPIPVAGQPYDSGQVGLLIGLGDVVGWMRVTT